MASKLASKKVVKGINLGDGNVVASEIIPETRWDDTNTELFLKTCIEKVHNGNRPHIHITKKVGKCGINVCCEK